MKKIAIFHPSAELYGADRIMVVAAKAMKHYKPVIYLPVEGPLVDFIGKEIPNAEIKICKKMPIISRAMLSVKGAASVAADYLAFRRFIRKEYKKYHFECFYVNTLACCCLLPILKRLNVPVFTHVHEILENPKVVAGVTARLAFGYSNTVISVSHAVQQNLHSLCRRRKAASVVVHNGICPIRQLQPDQTGKKVRFYLFGRIKPEKGQWYVLEALRLIPKEELKNAEFHFVGGTLKGKEALKTDLIDKIATYQLQQSVRLKGFTPDISKEMAHADVCLVPSLMKDPFPTTVLEAMSVGKPVVATNTGGAKEAIEDWKTGFIIPPDSPKVFALVLRHLIRSEMLRNEIGEGAKKAFNQKFTVDHFTKRWITAIEAA